MGCWTSWLASGAAWKPRRSDVSEFDLIALIRQRTALSRGDVVLGIGDDAALLKPPLGQQLVACTDTLIAGVHFPHDTVPEDIGWKALAVNLSDLAAMGAAPAWATLALTMPQADTRFVERFANGFAALARKHDVALVGGDTTEGPLSITISAIGSVPEGQALLRSGAHIEDALFVTGTLGDAVGALQLLRDLRPGNRDSGANGFPDLFARLNRPEPRVTTGLALRGIANACIDVSDGLLADLGHICQASGVGAEIEADSLPISQQLRQAFAPQRCRDFALSGGDDYELCFTASEEDARRIAGLFSQLECGVTRIGRIVAEPGVRVLDANGTPMETLRRGWQHFAS
jgi:thiamine-monophosphate kinase